MSMAVRDNKKKKEEFKDVLQGKKIPLLTLDSNWYKLLKQVEHPDIRQREEALNNLLKRQGKMNTETKDIKRLKKKMMSEIVTMVDEFGSSGDKSLEKKIDDNKRLLADCNKRLEEYEQELIEVPKEIDKINKELMLMTMEQCYKTMKENEEQIHEISDWVTQIRIELKKRLIQKQEMEQKNHDIYTYMHHIFGADVIDIFDMSKNLE